MYELWNNGFNTNIVPHNIPPLEQQMRSAKETGWKWQEASLTSNQIKQNFSS